MHDWHPEYGDFWVLMAREKPQWCGWWPELWSLRRSHRHTSEGRAEYVSSFVWSIWNRSIRKRLSAWNVLERSTAYSPSFENDNSNVLHAGCAGWPEDSFSGWPGFLLSGCGEQTVKCHEIQPVSAGSCHDWQGAANIPKSQNSVLYFSWLYKRCVLLYWIRSSHINDTQRDFGRTCVFRTIQFRWGQHSSLHHTWKKQIGDDLSVLLRS